MHVFSFCVSCALALGFHIALIWFSFVFNASLKQSWQVEYIPQKHSLITVTSVFDQTPRCIFSIIRLKPERMWSFVFCVCRFYLVSAGVPIIICGITAAINIENYGSGERTPLWVTAKCVLGQVCLTLFRINESLEVSYCILNMAKLLKWIKWGMHVDL